MTCWHKVACKNVYCSRAKKCSIKETNAVLFFARILPVFERPCLQGVWCMCVCVCVCARARARARVRVSECVRVRLCMCLTQTKSDGRMCLSVRLSVSQVGSPACLLWTWTCICSFKFYMTNPAVLNCTWSYRSRRPWPHLKFRRTFKVWNYTCTCCNI